MTARKKVSTVGDVLVACLLAVPATADETAVCEIPAGVETQAWTTHHIQWQSEDGRYYLLVQRLPDDCVRKSTCRCDCNGDGIVDSQDLMLMVQEWGQVCEEIMP